MQCNVFTYIRYCALQIFIITIVHLLAANNKRTETWKAGKNNNIMVPDSDSRTAIGVPEEGDLHYTKATKNNEDISHFSYKTTIDGFKLEYQHFPGRPEGSKTHVNIKTNASPPDFVAKIKFDNIEQLKIIGPDPEQPDKIPKEYEDAVNGFISNIPFGKMLALFNKAAADYGETAAPQ